MLEYIKSFFRASVDDVIAEFTGVVEKLENLSAFHKAKVAVHNEKIKVLTSAADLAQRESDRAKAIADKIRSLVS